MNIVDVDAGEMAGGHLFQRQQVGHPFHVLHAVGMLVEIDVAVTDRMFPCPIAVNGSYTGGTLHGKFERNDHIGILYIGTQIQGLTALHVDDGPLARGPAYFSIVHVPQDKVSGGHDPADFGDPGLDPVFFVFMGLPVDLDGKPGQHPGNVVFMQGADAEAVSVGVFAGGMQNVVAQSDQCGSFGQIHFPGLYLKVIVSTFHRSFSF